MQPPSITKAEHWPPNYVEVFAWRQQQLLKMRADPKLLKGALAYYADPAHMVDFILHWVDTYDPRNAQKKDMTPRFPFIMFPKQEEMIQFVWSMLESEENGLIEKCRDAGATWACAAVSIWLWRFLPGAAVGWGSRKAELVDRIGDPSSIFEKLRQIIRYLPREFLPVGFDPDEHMSYMKILNPETGSSITGEIGDNIGRGGRTLIYFKDESAHYEHPDLVDGALDDNTRVQIDISSVNGLGNPFHTKRENGQIWSPGCTPASDRVNVFIFDWRDHPAKTQEWYDRRRERSKNAGLLHIFAQEVDRDYAASVEGIIIKQEWFDACVDAHIKLDLDTSGVNIAGLDVADGGGDLNALALIKGILLTSVDDFASEDTGKTTRRAISELAMVPGGVALQYDCIGVGAGVKAEANRLEEVGELPESITLVPWAAGAKPNDPDQPLYEVDATDEVPPPSNKEYYANLKAQSWIRLAHRMENTYRAITELISFEPGELFSISSDIPKLKQLKKEMCQPTMGRAAGSIKVLVNKTPKGTKSPNMGDAVVMASNPVEMPDPFVWVIGDQEMAA